MRRLTTGERRSKSWRRKLIKVDRDDTPSALDEELKHEARCCKATELVWEDPSGYQASADESCDAHGAPTSDPLGEISDDGTANASTSLHQDACFRGYSIVHAFLGSQECGVAVLRGVRVEVEPLHHFLSAFGSEWILGLA